MKNSNKQLEYKIKKLESKLNALAHHLKVDVVAEDDGDEDDIWFETIVKPWDKKGRFYRLR